MEKAHEIAQRLGIENFRGSNGWLTRWKARHNIKQRVISGESGDVRGETVESWLERIPAIVEGYDAKNIWNCDEMGCFWKALPDKGLAERKKSCKGGKRSKLRVTITFFVNALGESESLPIVIWKSENPRCFKGVKKSQLPVCYYSQKKSWMTADILKDILSKINGRLVRDQRFILLLMDNAGCHPPDMAEKFSNIRVVFLPANTTSRLQPLDLGIIKKFKTYYRKFFMRYVLTRIEECSTATEVTNSITILHAIQWIAEAWKCVDSVVIIKCFRKAGILDGDFNVVQTNVIRDDPFRDLDPQLEEDQSDPELLSLMKQTHGDEHCSFETFVCDNDCLATCLNMENEQWQDTFFAELGSTSKQTRDDDSNDDSDHDDVDVHAQQEVSLMPVPVITNYTAAVKALEDVGAFLRCKGHFTEASETMCLTDKITSLHCQSIALNARQTTLMQYMK